MCSLIIIIKNVIISSLIGDKCMVLLKMRTIQNNEKYPQNEDSVLSVSSIQLGVRT